MFKKILIANRGEIACRIIKTAKRLGILTVAVYSDADQNALHVSMADEAIYIGPSPSRESYLKIPHIIDAAIKTGAEAIHPGYGFLSENADFCRQCIKHQLVFIGPPVGAIEAMGSKSTAKSIMENAGVPLVPGYHGEDQSEAVLKSSADKMGYPVLLKAAAGGGGKGMRQVWSEQEFTSALAAAKRESMNAFGDDKMLVEKYLTQPRHVEIQVFCDQHGHAVFLSERDCSVQRRHQKVIEEAPAPNLSEATRIKMGEAAVNAARAIHYEGAGTVEFLLDADGEFYFMEMNTRLQVEHPVTEMVTGQDLVEWQLQVANGEPLPRQQQEIQIKGHAFEARIYAEDCDNDFLPCTGQLKHLQPPIESEFVRIDTGVLTGDEVSVYYDPMIAKLIVWGQNREQALQRLQQSLSEYQIKGLKTNVEFLYNLANSHAFQTAKLTTNFIDDNSEEIFHRNEQDSETSCRLAALYLDLCQTEQRQAIANNSNDPSSPWHQSHGWRLNQAAINHYDIGINGTVHKISCERQKDDDGSFIIHTEGARCKASASLTGNTLVVTLDGHRLQAKVAKEGNEYTLYMHAGTRHFQTIENTFGHDEDTVSDNTLTAPMNGTIIELVADIDCPIKQGSPLLVMEAMKMEHTLYAPEDGTITAFYYQAGDLVDGGSQLVEFKSTQESS